MALRIPGNTPLSCESVTSACSGADSGGSEEEGHGTAGSSFDGNDEADEKEGTARAARCLFCSSSSCSCSPPTSRLRFLLALLSLEEASEDAVAVAVAVAAAAAAAVVVVAVLDAAAEVGAEVAADEGKSRGIDRCCRWCCILRRSEPDEAERGGSSRSGAAALVICEAKGQVERESVYLWCAFEVAAETLSNQTHHPLPHDLYEASRRSTQRQRRPLSLRDKANAPRCGV